MFESVDVVVMPVSQTQAFPHNIDLPYGGRTIAVDQDARGYHEILFWAGLATMPGLPSVVVPIGPVNGLRWECRSSDRNGPTALLAIAGGVAEALELSFTPAPLVAGSG